MKLVESKKLTGKKSQKRTILMLSSYGFSKDRQLRFDQLISTFTNLT